MLQYIHEGHQGRERCLLRARNTVFWPRISYDIQELIERCIICQEHGKSQPIIGITQEIPPFPWHTLATDIFYWKHMDFLIVADVFSNYFLVRKLTVQPERNYIELTPGMAVWVQHRWNTSWEPAIVASQSSSNS